MAIHDPHRILGLERGASQAAVKAAWRRLAREHHPDLAQDAASRELATRRMAEINAAYEELRSDGSRSRSRTAGRSAAGGRPPAGSGTPGEDEAAARGPHRAPGPERPTGPPPDPPSRPVTARLDTTELFRPRNATTTPAGGGFRHHPRAHREPKRAGKGDGGERRASDPNGPLERLANRRPARHPRPSLDMALATEISFGKFCGSSLEEIAALEPTYLEWIGRTIRRDPELVAAVRVVLAALRRSRTGPDPRPWTPSAGHGPGAGPTFDGVNEEAGTSVRPEVPAESDRDGSRDEPREPMIPQPPR